MLFVWAFVYLIRIGSRISLNSLRHFISVKGSKSYRMQGGEYKRRIFLFYGIIVFDRVSAI